MHDSKPYSMHDNLHRTFSVGLVQSAVTADGSATLRHAVTNVREAAARGAQIICLQELFNSPYFCRPHQASGSTSPSRSRDRPRR